MCIYIESIASGVQQAKVINFNNPVTQDKMSQMVKKAVALISSIETMHTPFDPEKFQKTLETTTQLKDLVYSSSIPYLVNKEDAFTTEKTQAPQTLETSSDLEEIREKILKLQIAQGLTTINDPKAHASDKMFETFNLFHNLTQLKRSTDSSNDKIDNRALNLQLMMLESMTAKMIGISTICKTFKDQPRSTSVQNEVKFFDLDQID